MKLIKACIALCLVLSLLLAGCAVTPQSTDTAPDAAAQTDSQAAQSQQSTQTDDTAQSDAAAVSTAAETGSELFSNRDLSGEYDETEAVAISLTGDSASCTGSGVAIDGSTVTITQAGTYILTGTLYGSVIVNAADTEKVQLVLRGAAIYSETFAAIYVAQADKVFVTLDAGTLSELSNDGTFEQIDENNVDAVIFSKEDLTINGTGELVINAPAGHGIVSKDDLVLTSGTVEIEAASQALSGKDSVCIAGGTYYLTAGKDAIHSENADDPAKGNVYIADGSFQLSADGDGISASGTLTIDGGSYTIASGYGGADTTTSQKGLKAEGDLTVNGGSFTILATDDGIHSNGNVTIYGGAFAISTQDDGIHADNDTAIHGGEITVSQSYEGIEGLTITISGGKVNVTASDDGLNAAGGNDQSGFGGGWGRDGFGTNSACSLTISGGEVWVSAQGDGLDSNGSFTISGGDIYVNGPTNSGNGALDCDGSPVITGGRLVAVGSSGMAVNFGGESTQGAIMVTVGTQAAGSEITLTDKSGNVLLSMTAEKSYDCVNLSAPELEQGGVYTLTAGTYSETITLSSLIYGSGSGMGGFGGMGGMGGFGGR